ncbi:hypothetical protein LguiA_004649 [Lonicera macranthoides]
MKGDVYSYGILLMETFTRKKPTNEMFSELLTMRSWVYEASLDPIVQVVDANLIGRGDEDFLAKKECASSILHLALDCSTNIPTQRISMEDVVYSASVSPRGCLSPKQQIPKALRLLSMSPSSGEWFRDLVLQTSRICKLMKRRSRTAQALAPTQAPTEEESGKDDE